MSDGAKVALCWGAACLLAVGFLQLSGAADITPGYTFTPGEKNITDVKLNTATAGSVATSFYTGKSADTAVGADTVIFYSSSAGTFKKTTLTTLFGNAPAINGLSTINSVGNFSVATSKFTVAAADGAVAWLGPLTASSNAVFSLTKNAVGVGITNLSSGGSAVALSVDGSAGSPGNALKVYGGATFSGVTSWSNNATFYAAASVGTTLTVTGSSLLNGHVTLGDAAADTLTFNGTLAGTLTGTPTVSLTAVSADTAADSVLIADASDTSKLKMALLSTILPTKTNLSSSWCNAGSAITLTHGLAGLPQLVRTVLVCTNADLAYAVGDEINVEAATDNGVADVALWATQVTSTNIVLRRSSHAGNAVIMRKDTGAAGNITATNWNLKAYMVYFP